MAQFSNQVNHVFFSYSDETEELKESFFKAKEEVEKLKEERLVIKSAGN